MVTTQIRFPVEPWRLSEREFHRSTYRRMEATMALANGYMGQRASFEEGMPGAHSLAGTYVAGVFDAYPNPSMIQLKGRPAEPRQMVNLPNFLPVSISFDGDPVTLANWEIEAYERVLHLDRGVLTREVILSSFGGRRLQLRFCRFLSRARRHIAVNRVDVTVLDGQGTLEVSGMIDTEAANAGGRRHYEITSQWSDGLCCRTLKTGIAVAIISKSSPLAKSVSADETCSFVKVTAVGTSRDVDIHGDLSSTTRGWLDDAWAAGYDALLAEQEAAWADLWSRVELTIEEKTGDSVLTQGLHYSIYQMLQNAPHQDPTVNIGAKGLTGEHYFGTYFWDTEVFMLPMLALISPDAGRDLVKSRVNMLPGAMGKAAELGLEGAMYPFMSDADGNESCTLWQFGLMGIHVTGAVAWGIWFYYCVTGDLDTIVEGGIDVLVKICRFWLSRVYYRPEHDDYAINQVLGPDEYHQGVDNNFYTNALACDNLLKTVRLLALLKEQRPEDYAAVAERLRIRDAEIERFAEIADKIYLPQDPEHDYHLQDDHFHRLEPYDLRTFPVEGALNQVWSYDRIMRTRLLRQADVLVADLLFGDQMTPSRIRRDFEIYEPITTHDSSLSFCHHAVIAAQLRKGRKAYDYFLRTARLDLDDLHRNAWMGVHTACLAGAWQCVVLGFGGVRWYDGRLSLSPCLPGDWASYRFSICWHGTRLTVTVRPGEVELETDGNELEFCLGTDTVTASGAAQVVHCDTQLPEW